MSETRSRTNSGPSRFMGGAEISTKRTAPSLRTFNVSKVNWRSGPDLGALTTIFSLLHTNLAPLRRACCRCFGYEDGSTDQMSLLEIVVRLLHRAERIAIQEALDPTQSCHFDNLLQRHTTTVQACHQLRTRGLFEKVEGN